MYRYQLIRLSFLSVMLSVGLALLGCKDQGLAPQPEPAIPHYEPHPALVPEVVSVKFVEATTAQDASLFVASLGLSFKFGPIGTPLRGIISVPLGAEEHWVELLKAYPIVKSAERVLYVYVAD